MKELEYENFIPKQEEINGEFLEEIKRSRKFILEKVLKTNLTEVEKENVINYVDSILYSPIVFGKEIKIRGFYFKNECKESKTPNTIYINKYYIENRESTINHEMFHAVSAALPEDVSYRKFDKTKNSYIFSGLIEAMTSMYADMYITRNNFYKLTTKVIQTLCDGIDENLVFESFLRGDLNSLKNLIMTKYKLENTEEIDKLLACFEPFADYKTVNDKVFVQRSKCVVGMGSSIVKHYSKILANKAIKEGSKNPIEVFENAISNLSIDENFEYYFASNENEDGTYSSKINNNKQKMFYVDLKNVLKEDLKNEIIGVFESKFGKDKIELNSSNIHSEKIIESFATSAVGIKNSYVKQNNKTDNQDK